MVRKGAVSGWWALGLAPGVNLFLYIEATSKILLEKKNSAAKNKNRRLKATSLGKLCLD